MRTLTGRGRRAPPPTGRGGMSTGMGLFLIALGAILLLALRTDPGFGLNLHVVGAVMMAVGILGLLLPAVAQRPRHAVHSAASGDATGLREEAGSSTLTGPDVSVTSSEYPARDAPVLLSRRSIRRDHAGPSGPRCPGPAAAASARRAPAGACPEDPPHRGIGRSRRGHVRVRPSAPGVLPWRMGHHRGHDMGAGPARWRSGRGAWCRAG